MKLVDTRRRFAATLAALTLCTGAAAADPTFDLSGLPPYAPAKQLFGVLRLHASQLTLHLMHLWQDGFYALHPDIRFRDNILPSWFSGLCAGTEDLSVMGHEAWRPDLASFRECFGRAPLEILFATGGFDQNKRGNTPGVVVMVHKDNPLTGLTIEQIDGIFGDERSGGWQNGQWTTAAARGPEKNIRTWGQLGLKGAWADQPIRLYGTDAVQSLWAGTIQRVAFQGGTKWNPALHEMVRGDHVNGPSDVQTVSAVAADRYAIGFNFMKTVRANPGVKAMALAPRGGGPFIAPTMETFRDRSYPLVTGLYIYLDRAPGKPLPPRVKSFLSYVLSREGQQAIADDGMYVPLSPALAREQLRKLD